MHFLIVLPSTPKLENKHTNNSIAFQCPIDFPAILFEIINLSTILVLVRHTQYLTRDEPRKPSSQ